jgi:hypothetical protein
MWLFSISQGAPKSGSFFKSSFQPQLYTCLLVPAIYLSQLNLLVVITPSHEVLIQDEGSNMVTHRHWYLFMIIEDGS